LNHDYIALAATSVVTEFLATFKEFPPRQKAATFTIDQALEAMEASGTGGSVKVPATAAKSSKAA